MKQGIGFSRKAPNSAPQPAGNWRCGWPDMVVLNNAVRLNGLTSLTITKLDVLGGFDALNICTGYAYQGKVLTEFPSSLKVLSKCKPVYETLPGWSEDISGIRKRRPSRNTRNYLDRIEELSRISIGIISVGPVGMK